MNIDTFLRKHDQPKHKAIVRSICEGPNYFLVYSGDTWKDETSTPEQLLNTMHEFDQARVIAFVPFDYMGNPNNYGYEEKETT